MPLPEGLKAFERLDLERELVRTSLASQLFASPEQRVRLGRFEVVRRLGQGGMGAVYEAFDPERGGPVALKLLTRADARYIYRLKREFRALADVTHPNLVQLHELFCEGDRWFFSMEQVRGVQFDQWVAAPAPERWSRLRAALAQLCAAVQALHAAGKLHRDLKPSNVHVTAQGRVVVLDFGLVDESVPEFPAAQSGLAGTPAYLAPEQAAGERATTASDYYALGVMLFEALTGCLPFQGGAWAVLDAKQRDDAPDPRTLVAGLPDDLCELCRGLLRREPAQRTDGRAIEALVSVQAQHASAAPAADARLLLGRDRELEALDQALAAVQPARPGAVLLSGPSGIGKSALLRRFDEVASARGALVLSGRCHERESVPFKVFDGVVDALSEHLRRLTPSELCALLPRHLDALLQLFPVLASSDLLTQAAAELRTTGGDARELRKRAFAGFKELLLRLTDHQVVVLAVDDLQWGDGDSAQLLTYLLAPPEPPRVLFIGSYREDEAAGSDFLRGIAPDGAERERSVSFQCRPQRLEVGSLEPEVAAELARVLLGAASRQRVGICEAIAHEADGVPFLIAELAQHEAAWAEEPGAQRGALSLEHVILQRVARLPQDARELLRVVSVAAGPVEQGIALEAAGGSALLAPLLRELRSARLLRGWGSRPFEVIETYHDRVRDTVVRHVPADALKRIHGRLAEAIRHAGQLDPERLVTHYTGAGQSGAAGEMAVEAAHAATRTLAFQRAAQLFAKAIELLPRAEQDRHGLHERLGEALANAGRSAASAEAYLQAAGRVGPPHAARLRRLAAQQYFRSGRSQAGLALTHEAIRAAGISLPGSELGMVRAFLVERARLRLRGLRLARPSTRARDPRAVERMEALGDLFAELSVVDTLKGALLQTRYLREALAAGDRARALHAMTWEVFNISLLGGARNRRRASAVMVAARELAAGIDTPYARGAVLMAEASRLLWNGTSFEDACTPALAAEEIFSKQCQGAFWERALVVYIRLLCLEFSGDLKLHAAAALENLREGAERDDRFVALLMLLAVPYAYLMRDDPRGAREFLEEQRAWLGSGFTPFEYMWWMRMIETEIYSGHAERGMELVRSQWPQFRRSHLARCEFVLGAAQIFASRCALAAYHQHPSAELRRTAQRLITSTADADTGYGAYRQAFVGSHQAAAGDRSGAIQSLTASTDRLLACQAGLVRQYAQRVLAQLRADDGELARVDGELRRQGVVNPARWVWNHIPYGPQP